MISKPIVPGNDLHLLIGDLKREKNTVKILYDLNKAFPFAEKEEKKLVQKYLGEISTDFTDKAIKAIQRGTPERLGSLMTSAQQSFDAHLMNMCDELKSQRLHEILADPAIKNFKLSTIQEKPTKDLTSEFLGVETGGKSRYFCVNGVYILLLQSMKSSLNSR